MGVSDCGTKAWLCCMTESRSARRSPSTDEHRVGYISPRSPIVLRLRAKPDSVTQTVLEIPQAARGMSLSPPRRPTSRWTRLAITVAGASARVGLMAGSRAASAQGPSVHIDVRDSRARWGAI